MGTIVKAKNGLEICQYLFQHKIKFCIAFFGEIILLLNPCFF